MKTMMKFFMVAVVGLFASFAMAETVSLLPVSETCSKVLQPALKEANVTFTELKTEAGMKKFLQLSNTNRVLVKNALSVCKNEPQLGSEWWCKICRLAACRHNPGIGCSKYSCDSKC